MNVSHTFSIALCLRAFALVVTLLSILPAFGRSRIELNGIWTFQLDPENRGGDERWFLKRPLFSDTILVPGCWQAQGFGEKHGILRHQFVGKTWYKRNVKIPSNWKGKSVRLHLGGALRETVLYINGTFIGEHRGFSTPFSFDISSAVRPSEWNTIALRVSNASADIDKPPDKQSATDPAGMLTYIGNWGGVYGTIELQASGVWIEEVAIHPHLARQSTGFRVSILDPMRGSRYQAELRVTVRGGDRTYHVNSQVEVVPGQPAVTQVMLPMPGARAWSPDTPHLYIADIALFRAKQLLDRTVERFGVREITVQGNTLLLNGRPLYLRGYGDDNVEVIGGVPPASKEVHLRRLQLAKSFGFNAVRFHSMTPVRQFFEAADEVGMLVMAELPVAYAQYFLPHKEFLRGELNRTLLTYRNHPSFLSLAFGNEFNLRWIKTDAGKRDFLRTVDEFYRRAKSIDPDRIILSNDGYLVQPTDMVSLVKEVAEHLPTVRHEFGGYYCSLPDVSLIPKFTGVIEPVWLEQKRTWVLENGLSELYPLYVTNSQRLQQLGRKYQIEKVRSSPGVTGYHYWLIVDFPGGTGEGDSWEEGWFDYFWGTKKIDRAEAAELNAAVMPLIDAGVSDRTIWAEEQKRVEVRVSNYGPVDLHGATLLWRLTSEGTLLASGKTSCGSVPAGAIRTIGELTLRDAQTDHARKLEVAVEIWRDKRLASNRWTFWSFPRKGLLSWLDKKIFVDLDMPSLFEIYPFVRPMTREPDPAVDLLITDRLSRQHLQYLQAGGRVWLILQRHDPRSQPDSGFFPAPGGSLGTLLLKHPALNGFPHDGFCDVQFYNLLDQSSVFSIDDLPRGFMPIAGGLRTTTGFLSRDKRLSKIAYISEFKVGDGKLLLTALNFRDNFARSRPEALYLFDRLFRYMVSLNFAPVFQIGLEQLLPYVGPVNHR